MIRCCTQTCPDRNSTCHTTCSKYLKEKAEHEADMERVRKIKNAKFDYIDYSMRNQDAIRRRNK